MRNAKLGTKRQCQACGARFYDLGETPGGLRALRRRGRSRIGWPSDGRAPRRPAADEPADEREAPAAPPDPGRRAAPTPPQWSAEQSAALDAVGRWLKAGEPQVFRLFGYAGVGKTTLARHVAEAAQGEAAFAAFTGKAALVMRSKGCAGASTIHALIYRASEGEEGAPTFTLNHDGPASRAGLIVIDECSMVDAELGRDLLSFGKPILVLGDPAQLPPVKGGGFFTEAEPDVMLTEIHRQAENDPIIRLVRDRALRRRDRLWRLRREPRHPPRRDRRRRRSRRRSGAGRRQPHAPALQPAHPRNCSGMTEALPVAGDKLVCLRNDRVKGLINGGLWRVEALGGMRKDFVRMTVRSEDDVGRAHAKVAVLKQFFEGAEADLPYPVRRESDEFDYGYALTVHKAQGSQWDSVDAVRREPRLPRAPRALALHRADARRAQADARALTTSAASDSPRAAPARAPPARRPPPAPTARRRSGWPCAPRRCAAGSRPPAPPASRRRGGGRC